MGAETTRVKDLVDLERGLVYRRVFADPEIYRTRLEHDRDLFVGTRTDVLRRVDGQLGIAERTVILDQVVLDAKNVSVFL